MALRRPPTAISLKPSDVNDLREFIKNRNHHHDGDVDVDAAAAGAKPPAGDAILDRERKDAQEREARGARARVLGH
ncbi:hypothetical protein JCM11491_000129 [Sporobolomyces phaffii]